MLLNSVLTELIIILEYINLCLTYLIVFVIFVWPKINVLLDELVYSSTVQDIKPSNLYV